VTAIRLTDHRRSWQLRRHLGQAALGAQVGLGTPTRSVDEDGSVDMPPPRRWLLAHALSIMFNACVTSTNTPTPPGDEPPT
jgi:hypothetical protein